MSGCHLLNILSCKLTSEHSDVYPLVNLNVPCTKIWFLSSNANILYMHIYVEVMSLVSEARVGSPTLFLSEYL